MTHTYANPEPARPGAGQVGTRRTASVPSGLPTPAALFAPDGEGAGRAGDFLSQAVRGAGMPWIADRTALAAYLAALWLARTGTEPHPVSAAAHFDGAERKLRIWVADRNRLLPKDLPTDNLVLDHQVDGQEVTREKLARLAVSDLLSTLAEQVDAYTLERTPDGRVLVCEIGVRRAYQTRATWISTSPVSTREPAFGYAEFDSEQSAREYAAAWLGTEADGMRLVEVGLAGPEDFEGAWTRIAPVSAAPPGGAGASPVGAGDLSPARLAEVTQAALKECAYDWVWRRGRGDLRPRTLSRVLADTPTSVAGLGQIRRLAQFVLDAKPSGGPAILDPVLKLIAVTHGHVSGPLSGLSDWLGSALFAWGELHPPVAKPSSDPYEQAELLSLAGCWRVVARDRYTGARRIAPELSALGMAGALFAEALLAGRVTVNERTRRVSATGSEATDGLSMASLSFIATVRDAPRPRPLGDWLAFLAKAGEEQIERALIEATILAPADTEPQAIVAHPTLVERVIARAAAPDTQVTGAVLLALVRATGLDQADAATWNRLSAVRPEPALGRAGPGIVRLIEDVAAAVTAEVANVLR